LYAHKKGTPKRNKYFCNLSHSFQNLAHCLRKRYVKEEGALRVLEESRQAFAETLGRSLHAGDAKPFPAAKP